MKYASDYFDKLYEFALWFIDNDLAYVDDLTPEQMREYRGTLTSPGKDSPYRTRSAAETVIYFTRMKDGELPMGQKYYA